MTPYCGTVAKKGAALQQRLLGLKSAVMCNSHLLASASGGGLRHRRPSSVTALIRGHQTPEFRGLLTAFVSLWLEFQEKQVGSSPDNLLFFKWTREAAGEHGLVNMLHLGLQNCIKCSKDGSVRQAAQAQNKAPPKV